MGSSIAKSVHRLLGFGLCLGMLTSLPGCTKAPRTATHVEVTGKVTFKGKPLPGGQVKFIAVLGGFASTAPIDEQGNYKINAPVGEVKIGVDNAMLQKSSRGGPPKSIKHPRPPSAKEDEHPIKGTYVQIPRQYADPETSGLSYTVTPAAQSHNIDLSDNPPPPPSEMPGAS